MTTPVLALMTNSDKINTAQQRNLGDEGKGSVIIVYLDKKPNQSRLSERGGLKVAGQANSGGEGGD